MPLRCAPGLVVAAGQTPARAGLHGNNFFVDCRFSHTSNDDPIVLPGMPGRSHAHTFFGNRSTDARSTLASLRAAGTHLQPAADEACLSVPTLYQDGEAIRPGEGAVLLQPPPLRRMAPFPAGLKMVAGQARPVTVQSTDVVWWACGGSGGARSRKFVRVPAHCGTIHMTYHGRTRKCPTCPLVPTTFENDARTYLELHVNFPDCWDGRHLDSPDHRSHMASAGTLVCPASHPVKVPAIQLMIRYPVRDGAGIELASGGQLTGHADFFDAWNQTALAHLVNVCFMTGRATTRGARTRLAARQPPGPRSQAARHPDRLARRWTRPRKSLLAHMPGGRWPLG